MAQNIVQQQNNRPQRERKLRLASLFTDAPVRVEPEEPKKVVTAGLVEASVKKDYPDTYFKRALAVFRGEFTTLLKSTVFFLIFTIPFIIVLAWFAGWFEERVLGQSFNFMGDIGIGFPGVGVPDEHNSIAIAVSKLYWDVKAPVVCLLAASLIIGSFGLSGLFYCAKRSYFQDTYKRVVRTYWMGFAKYWWQYLVTLTFAVLVGLAMSVSLLNLLSLQAKGAADAGAYVAVVFAFVIGAPLLTVPMVMAGLFASHELTFVQAFKNAIVIIANTPIVVAIVGILSAAPLLVLIVDLLIVRIIIYIVMAAVGTTFMALMWTALASRGMMTCHELYQRKQKEDMVLARRQAKQNPYAGGANRDEVFNAQKKKKPQQNHYQNPKKKKKK